MQKHVFFVFSYGSDADKLYVLVLYTAIYPRRKRQAAKVSKTPESKEAKTRKVKVKIWKITGIMFEEEITETKSTCWSYSSSSKSSTGMLSPMVVLLAWQDPK